MLTSEGGIVLVNRIAYISPGGELFTVDPTGTNLVQLTGNIKDQVDIPGLDLRNGTQFQPLQLNEYHTWPTWSADGMKLAASKVKLNGDSADVSIQILDAFTGRSETIYENGLAGLVAEGAPHYIYWAPIGNQLSFLASTSDGLSLFVKDEQLSNQVNVINRGAPLYYQWSSNAQSMAIHLGLDIIWANAPGPNGTTESFRSAGNFRTPAISPNGQDLAYVDEDDSGSALFISPVSDLNQSTKFINLGYNSAVMWSPDGTQLAIANQSNPGTPLYDQLMLVPLDGSPAINLTSGNNPSEVWAFFWSPKGDKLAWVAVNPEEQELEWMVSPSNGSYNKSLFSFQPSSEVFIMLSFFDQYAYSHSPWSPDGKSLVVAGTKGKVALRSNGRTPTGARIFVLDVEGNGSPSDLGAGVLGVWSWN